jgi:hypothetical protein
MKYPQNKSELMDLDSREFTEYTYAYARAYGISLGEATGDLWDVIWGKGERAMKRAKGNTRLKRKP